MSQLKMHIHIRPKDADKTLCGLATVQSTQSSLEKLERTWDNRFACRTCKRIARKRG